MIPIRYFYIQIPVHISLHLIQSTLDNPHPDLIKYIEKSQSIQADVTNVIQSYICNQYIIFLYFVKFIFKKVRVYFIPRTFLQNGAMICRPKYYNNSMIPSAIAVRMIQQDVAPASRTPLERSPRRLERPNFATISLVESRPFSAAAFISSNASL